MVTVLTIIRYKKRFIPFALLAMAVFRVPLAFKKNISFYKLVGCGKNGSFDKTPDWQQWGILTVHKSGEPAKNDFGRFIASWIRFFNCEVWTVVLQPIEGHGTWDKKEVFGPLPKQTEYEGPIAVLTRATIRISKMKSFWQHVDGVSAQMAGSPGFVSSAGIGEVPWIKQATFSVWQSKESMRQFAYTMKAHQEVIVKTKKEKWYSEDMFVRFRIISSNGSIKGKDPLATLTLV
jgi:hypothetical protein